MDEAVPGLRGQWQADCESEKNCSADCGTDGFQMASFATLLIPILNDQAGK